MTRNLLGLGGLAGGVLAGDWHLRGQEQTGTGGDRLAIRDQAATALESGRTDEAKTALVKALATKWMGEGKDADIQTMLEAIRATGNQALAVRIFRDFLADPALAIPAASALPDANDPFLKAVEAGRADAIRDWIGASLRKAGEPTVRQMTALTTPPAWLGEGFVKWLMHGGMLGTDDPRSGGRLAARVLLLMEWRARPMSRTIQADYLAWQMENSMNEGDVARMTAYFAGVAEVCPAFASGGEWDRTVAWPMAKAWRKRLADVAKQEDPGAGADWRKTIEACFVTPARNMAKEERIFAAAGLEKYIESLLDPATLAGSSESPPIKLGNAPATRAERVKALTGLFQPYPEFQVVIERKQLAMVPPGFPTVQDEPPALMVRALQDSTSPPAQRFAMVGELSRVPKPRYQEVAAAGFVLAMRDYLRTGADLNSAALSNQLYQFQLQDRHEVWIKAAAEVATMAAAAFKTQPKREAWKDNAIIKRIIECAIIGRARALTAGLIESHGAALHGDTHLITALAEAGWLDLASTLCNRLPEILPFDGYPRFVRPPDWLPRLLEGIVSKSDRYRIELTVSSLSCEGTAPKMEETVMARLMPLAERYAETADMPIASRMQCLALLCREPTVAYRLKEELERVAAAIRPNSFRSRGTILGGLDTREAWYLEAAFLGNLLRDGRHDEITKRLETVLANPSAYEAGAAFLDLCLRQFHEHALWLLADGHRERVAEAIPLSLRLYASIMGPGPGWNYRDHATMFVELCHATGKRYAEFETWLAGQSNDTRADYRQRRYGPKEFKIPWISAFYQLGGCHDLRGGWDGEACEDLRIAGILALTGDPALVKAQSEGKPLAEIVALNLLRTAKATPEDKLALIARWRERHPNHPLLDETERLLRKNAVRAGSQ
ncbi:MAG: hypothetical protein NTW21_15445 [Verrucomicrobia bacterium]|nr:hypothetical protein [Verrucomicrobiota bacterium]